MSTPASSKKRPFSGEDVDDEEAPEQKRFKPEEEVQVMELPDVSAPLYNFFRLVGQTGVWLPQVAAFLPFWYDDTSYGEKTYAAYCGVVRDWVEVPEYKVTRRNASAKLVGVDESGQRLYFCNPRGPGAAPLTAPFRIEFGVPLGTPTTHFPYLAPVGGREQLRDAKLLHEACMSYLRKAVTTYCLPKKDDGGERVFVKACGWRKSGNGTVVKGKNSKLLHLMFQPDPATGNLALLCFSDAVNNPIAMEKLFTPAVIYNIKLVLETYTILAQLPLELRLTCKRFAPQLDLVKKFAKEGDL